MTNRRLHGPKAEYPLVKEGRGPSACGISMIKTIHKVGLRTGLVAAVISLGALTANASATLPSLHLWVGPGHLGTSGAGTSCTDVAFHKIQSAINAAETASGAVLEICPGTYHEQVQITGTSTLVIRAAFPGQATVLAPPASPVSSTTPCDTAPGNSLTAPNLELVAVCGTSATHVTWTNVALRGSWPASSCTHTTRTVLVGGHSHLSIGVLSISNGGTLPVGGCNSQVGLQIGLGATTPIETAVVGLNNVLLSDYQRAGVAVEGAGTVANMTSLHVTGAGLTGAVTDGVRVTAKGLARIVNSYIKGNECSALTCGSNPITKSQSSGVYFAGAAKGSLVDSTTTTANDRGVYYVSAATSLPGTPELRVQDNSWLSGNRYENFLIDQGSAYLGYSHVNGGSYGVMALQHAGVNPQLYGPHLSAEFSNLNGAQLATVKVLSDQLAGDKPGSLDFFRCVIKGRIVSNSLTVTITH